MSASRFTTEQMRERADDRAKLAAISRAVGNLEDAESLERDAEMLRQSASDAEALEQAQRDIDELKRALGVIRCGCGHYKDEHVQQRHKCELCKCTGFVPSPMTMVFVEAHRQEREALQTAESALADLQRKVKELEGILTDIIYASDGCVGHGNCNHSIEPWKRARAVLGLTPSPEQGATK